MKQIKMLKKYILGLAIASMIFVPAISSAQTIESLTAQIQSLLSTIASLQAQLATISGGGTVPTQPIIECTTLKLANNLYLGSKDSETDNEVTKLQTYLAKNKNIYPEGLITGFFGPATEGAVKRWQAQNGVVSSGSPETTGYGVVGPATRTKMVAACGSQVEVDDVDIIIPPPTYGKAPSISGISGPTTLNVNQSGQWEVRASDPENGQLSYSVRWGDEDYNFPVPTASLEIASTQTATFTHTYTRAGTYYPRFTVMDNTGLTSVSSISVQVGNTQINTPPITLLSPNGGEVYRAGDTINNLTIDWAINVEVPYNWQKGTDGIPLVNFSLEKGGQFVKFISSTHSGGRPATFAVPDVTSGNDYRIKIGSIGNNDINSRYYDVSDAPFSIIAGTTNSQPAVTVNGKPNLRIVYDQANKEASLSATYNISIKASAWSDLKLHKYNEYDNEMYFGGITLGNTNSAGDSVNGSYYKLSGNAIDRGNYWNIPAGQTASFNVAGDFNPKILFAGSYNATLYFYKPFTGADYTNTQVEITGNKTTNSVTIIGETSPYINNVVSDATPNVNITISGVRFHPTSNKVTIVEPGGSVGNTRVLPSLNNGTVINTSMAEFGLNPSGHYEIQVSHPNEGASNSFVINIDGTKNEIPIADLVLTGVRKGDFHKYGLLLDICMNGPKSINDLKQVTPKLNGYPTGYIIYNNSGIEIGKNFNYDSGGSVEYIKNGECNNGIGTVIANEHQQVFESGGTVEFILDPYNLINETNEKNNRAKYNISNTQTRNITVKSPNGGEALTIGQNQTITWDSNKIDSVYIMLLNDTGTGDWIAANIPNTGSYEWKVSKWNTTSTKFKIRIIGYETGVGSVTDESDNLFTLTSTTPQPLQPSITALYPAGGETLNLTEKVQLKGKWINMKSLSLAVYRNGIFHRWIEEGIVPGCATTCEGGGIYNWDPSDTIPVGDVGQQYKFKIFFQGIGNDGVVYKTFSNEFNIVYQPATLPAQPTISAIYPAGGETLYANTTTTLKGSWTNMQSLSFALYKNGAFYKWIVSNIVPGCGKSCAEGKYNWMPSSTIPASETGTQHSFKIFFQGYGTDGKVYNAFTNEFKIDAPTLAPTVSVIYPAGGETLNVGDSVQLKGSWSNVQSLSLALYKNGTLYKWIVEKVVPGCSTTCVGGGLYNWVPANTIPANEVGSPPTFKLLLRGYGENGVNVDIFSNDFKIINPPSTVNNQPKGNFERIEGENAVGWTFDPDSSSNSSYVHFYIDTASDTDFSQDKFAGSVYANMPRGDVNSTYGITGNHGFSFLIPLKYRDGQTHTIRGYSIDPVRAPHPIIGVKTFQLSATTASIPEETLSQVASVLNVFGGLLDQLSRLFVR